MTINGGMNCTYIKLKRIYCCNTSSSVKKYISLTDNSTKALGIEYTRNSGHIGSYYARQFMVILTYIVPVIVLNYNRGALITG